MLPKTLKNASVEDVKNENSEAYNTILALGKSERDEEVSKLQAEVANLKREASIRKAAANLNQVALGETLISENASFEVALDRLSSAGLKKEESNRIAGFIEATAPKKAGSDSQSEHNTPKSAEEAITLAKSNLGEKATRRECAQWVCKNFPQFGGR